jgi:hypothetical protein
VVIDSTRLSIQQVFEKMMSAVNDIRENKSRGVDKQ